jgi:hypothetical protein
MRGSRGAEGEGEGEGEMADALLLSSVQSVAQRESLMYMEMPVFIVALIQVGAVCCHAMLPRSCRLPGRPPCKPNNDKGPLS